MDAIVRGYEATKYVNYLGVSGHALVVADFLHTLPDEVRLIWPTPLRAPKILFLGLRYYLLVHTAFAVMYGLPLGMSPEECLTGMQRVSVSSILIVVACEAILFIRVYAFSGRNKKLLVYLILQFIALHISAAVFLYKFLRTIKFVKLPIPNLVCMPAEAQHNLLGVVFSLVLVSVIVVMFFMVYIAFRKNRNFNSGLLTIFYQDGIFYFICLSALASANIVVNLAAPEDSGLKFLLIQPEVDLHVILSTRMLLHLRGWAEWEKAQGRAMEAFGTSMAAFQSYCDRPMSPMMFMESIDGTDGRGGRCTCVSGAPTSSSGADLEKVEGVYR